MSQQANSMEFSRSPEGEPQQHFQHAATNSFAFNNPSPHPSSSSGEHPPSQRADDPQVYQNPHSHLKPYRKAFTDNSCTSSRSSTGIPNMNLASATLSSTLNNQPLSKVSLPSSTSPSPSNAPRTPSLAPPLASLPVALWAVLLHNLTSRTRPSH